MAEADPLPNWIDCSPEKEELTSIVFIVPYGIRRGYVTFEGPQRTNALVLNKVENDLLTTPVPFTILNSKTLKHSTAV